MKSPYFAYAMIWVATSAATITAIVVTKSAIPLWAMIIPTLISIKGNTSDGGSESNESARAES